MRGRVRACTNGNAVWGRRAHFQTGCGRSASSSAASSSLPPGRRSWSNVSPVSRRCLERLPYQSISSCSARLHRGALLGRRISRTTTPLPLRRPKSRALSCTLLGSACLSSPREQLCCRASGLLSRRRAHPSLSSIQAVRRALARHPHRFRCLPSVVRSPCRMPCTPASSSLWSNVSIERTPSGKRRLLPAAAHVKP
jgi:hypothetical protein